MERNKKINLDKIQNILVLMLGGIGNLILMLPALRALREKCPHQKITLLTAEPHVEDVIMAEGLIDEAVFFDQRKTRSLKDMYYFIGAMRKEHFDLALVSSSTNSLKAGLLTFLMGIPCRVGENIQGRGFFYTHKVFFKKGQTHELDGSLNVLKAIGIHAPETIPSMNLADDDMEMAAKFLTKKGVRKGDVLVGLHTGCGYKQTSKRWMKECFAAIADEIVRRYHVKVVLTGGPQEGELVKEVIQLMKESSINAAAQLSIRQTAALIKRCQLFISNDSGPAHISTAVNTSLLVLFGDTELWRIIPRGKNVHLIKKDQMDLISQEDVLNVLKGILGE